MNEKELLQLTDAEKWQMMIKILNKQIEFKCEERRLEFGTNQYNLFN